MDDSRRNLLLLMDGKRFWSWVVLLCISALIHVYLLAMVCVLWVAYCLRALLSRTADAKFVGFHLMILPLVLAGTMW
jgi:hypothetical protein